MVGIINRVKRLFGPLCFGFDNVFSVLPCTSIVLLNFLLELKLPNIPIGFLGWRWKFRPVLQWDGGNIVVAPVSSPVFLVVNTPKRSATKISELRDPIIMPRTKKSLAREKHLNPVRA